MPYVQSDQVKTYYSKGSEYLSSWNDPLLEAIFANSKNASTTTPKTDAEINQPAHQISAGVIAGGVLGGIVGLVGILFAAWLCFKWRRKRKTALHPITEQNTTAQRNEAIPYGIKPELDATTPARLDSNPPQPQMLGPEARRQLPELAVTTPAGNMHQPQPQMLGSEARHQLPELGLSRQADGRIELPESFSRW